ncbi:MAG: hypothetical protein HYW23_02885 [Candidatus Aenigmarchaeota archaeon]|nr:hypothetical protein [Candidatus Aenigmarchaeota archaeon]
MRKIFIIGLLSFLLIISPAFALNITVSTDKTKVFMGDTVTLTGKIAFDNGTTTSFQYRAAFVAPKGIIVCDSNKTTTPSDGTFTLQCKLPTATNASSLGIPASDSRSVIPYVAGVAVKNPDTNQTIKKHAKEVLAVNPDKFGKELDKIAKDVDEFANNSKRFAPECDSIAEKAAKFNLTNITTQCLEIQQKLNDMLSNATNISSRAMQLKGGLNATSLQDFRELLKSMKDSQKDLRDELKNVKENIQSVRWDTLKEIKKSTQEIRQDIQKEREEINKTRHAINQQETKLGTLRNISKGISK